MRNQCAIVLLVILLTRSIAADGISISPKQCGQKHCKYTEYCSEVDRRCQPCDKICNSSTHNFDPILCEKNCQDYLHDQRYLRGDNKGSQIEDLEVITQKLSNLSAVTLALVCLILVILLSTVCFLVYTWKRKENVTLDSLRTKFFAKKSDTNANKPHNTAADQSISKPDLRLEITTSDAHSDNNSPVTMTTTTRRPAEDATTEYAYDNPAMTRSPNGSSKTQERTF